MSLTLLFGLMTLTPAVVAILLGIFSRVTAFRVPPQLAMGLAVLAAAVPVIGLILFASDLAFPTPVRFAFAGNSSTPFAPLFRADGLTSYAAWGIAALVVPLLLWIVWMDAGRSEDSAGRLLAELGLTLGLEVCALQLVFSDNLLWLGLVWLALVALTWLLGEQGADRGEFDYLGLVIMLVGPALTIVMLLVIAITTQDHTFYALTGHSAASSLQVILLGLTLAAAGGGYPFAAWVRRRAAFTTPSGFAALILLVLPVVLFVALRSWGALQGSTGLWPEIGAVTPPITGGIALAVLGTLAVAVSGLLALGRRDGRTLVALLATAQVGWGLLALGSSQPVAAIGTVVLLATGVVGLGAMIASLVAGGILTADDEPDGAGPVPFGVTPRPLNLFAWCVGAATALGVPLFGGFVSRHLITSGTLFGTKLGVPLLGLAWLGDALFAVTLIRATVLAFKADEVVDEDDAEEVAEEVANDSDNDAEEVANDSDNDAEEVADDGEDEEAIAEYAPSTFSEIRELPGVILALVAVALGIFPQTFMNMGVLFATEQVSPEGAASGALHVVQFGYATSNGQWLPGIFWLGALVLGVVVLLLRIGTQRSAVTLETGGDGSLTGMESDALDEPAVVWVDLAPSFTSPWTQLAGKQLIGGIDEEDEYTETQLDAVEDESGDDISDATNPPDDSADSADSADITTTEADSAAANDVVKDESATENKKPKQGNRKPGQRGQAQK